MFSSRGVGVGFSSFICSSQPSRLGRSSPYGMDLLPVLVGGTGVRYLLLVSSSLSVGVFQFWSFGLGLGGYVGCGHRCTCSTQVHAVGVWFLLGFWWSMSQGFAPLRWWWRVCGVGSTSFLLREVLSLVLSYRCSMVWRFSTSSFSPNKSFVLERTLSAALKLWTSDYSIGFMFVALLMVNRCRIEAAI
ncbi:hypothetical protein F2Q68_00041457 [Brassica cretica]|uniref:Uncharacterized protein n=1 Tax=Brassica cretica TaxID=69181 RepID=A0A8S9MR90_BRACR|nr:hypothetical protein F2Q68_00041457 [Brassica cretica]